MGLNDTFFLSVSAILFLIGTSGVLLRRGIIVILMSIEMMLNAVNLAFAAFAARFQAVDGQVFVFFVMAVAAAEAAVGLAIVIALFRLRGDTDADGASRLRW